MVSELETAVETSLLNANSWPAGSSLLRPCTRYCISFLQGLYADLIEHRPCRRHAPLLTFASLPDHVRGDMTLGSRTSEITPTIACWTHLPTPHWSRDNSRIACISGRHYCYQTTPSLPIPCHLRNSREPCNDSLLSRWTMGQVVRHCLVTEDSRSGQLEGHYYCSLCCTGALFSSAIRLWLRLNDLSSMGHTIAGAALSLMSLISYLRT
ncbi:hypothetical protein BJY52DRAFT_729307 [Lactarius psammicola]|nr:hypothetical protein BJY52DRAFT_729307 [Lactarius psammicola]